MATANNPVEITIKAQSIVSSTFTGLRESYLSALESGVAVEPVLNEDTSVSRLIVLAALLEIFKATTFIETQTQHRISASVVAKCNAENNLNLSIYSIDIDLPYLVKSESDINYILLKRPARKVF